LVLAISATIILGMVRYRNRLTPEIAYCLISISALMLIIPSAARYLMPYQPLLWIFFYGGAALSPHLSPRESLRREERPSLPRLRSLRQ
jgi:hypothetical protein